MSTTKLNQPISKHVAAITITLFLAIVMISSNLWFFIRPEMQQQADLETQHEQIEEELAELRMTLHALPELNDVDYTPDVESHDPMLDEQWATDDWQFEFTRWLNKTEQNSEVIISNMTFQQGSEIEPVTNVALNEYGVSLVMSGTLQQIVNVIEQLYKLPSTFSISSWNLSPGASVSVEDGTSTEEHFTMNLQGKLQLVY